MRALYGESNSLNLTLLNVTAPHSSDQLFKGRFATKSLIHSLLLEIEIRCEAEDTPTEASLGDVTIMSTREGRIQTLPLRMLLHSLPNIGVPCHIATGDQYYIVHIPIPFALLKGIRSKDTYLVSEKCNDYYLEINGADEQITYTKYRITPLIIAEKSLNAVVPSKGYLHYTTDIVPAGVWWDSHLRIKGANIICIAQSDYADFIATDQIKVTVDGEVKLNFSDIRRCNRVYAYTHVSRQDDADVLEAIPDDIIIIQPTLDKKDHKVSRNSESLITFYSVLGFTVQCLYQTIDPYSAEDTKDISKRQGVNVNDPLLKLVPVDAIGELNPNAKGTFRKAYTQSKTGKVVRIKNTA